MVRLSRPLLVTALLVATLILFTSSFDVFLVLNAGGNYRFCQLLTPVLVTLALIKSNSRLRLPVLGTAPLAIWFAFQVIFVPATDFWPKSVGYCLWLFLNLGLVYAFVQLFADMKSSVETLVRLYISSFAAIAMAGILQFTMPLVGLPGVLVQQWWIPGEVARANAFSYEPSYFASYLIIGFVFCGSLRRVGSGVATERTLLAVQAMIGVGVLLSSSRIGIVFLFGDILLAQTRPWLRVLAGFKELRMNLGEMRSVMPSVLSILFLTAISAAAANVLRSNPALGLMLLNGTGISDTAAHSVVQRENALLDTVGVFWDHPLIGRSLGGVSSAIADREGDSIQSFDDGKSYEGMSVFAEILAASGLVGFVPFAWFVWISIRKPLQLAARTARDDAALLRACVRALIFAWAILQFNQNVLRPYLWVHVAILATVYASAMRKAPERTRQTLSR